MKNQAGRPNLYAASATRTLSFSMPESLVPAINAAAKAKGKSRSQFMTALVAAHLGESVEARSNSSYRSNALIS